MKNWIYYKEQHPLNLDTVEIIYGVELENEFVIAFQNYRERMLWRFDTKEERDAVFEAIKKQMTEIELEYHPDHDFENE